MIMKYLKIILAYTYVLTIGVLGLLLYYLSKILRSIGYLLLLKFGSSRSEMTNFFKVNYGSGDF